jgi:hypothetical protein
MKKIIARWKAECPDFFKKVKKGALSIGGSAVAVIVANSSLSLNLNTTLISILGYVIAACAFTAGTAQLTRQDNN